MLLKDKQLLEYLCEKYGTDVIEENFMDKFKKSKYAPIVVACMLSIAGTKAVDSVVDAIGKKKTSAETETTYKDNPEYYIQDYWDQVDAVEACMTQAARAIGKDFTDIDINPTDLVQITHKYNFDLPFLLAALHLESHFGTSDRARRTNSPCSIGLWDNGQNKASFNTMLDGIEAYIKIMQDNYGLNSINVDDILKRGKLVNGIGKRYASDPQYEKKLRNIRNKIIKNWPALDPAKYMRDYADDYPVL